MIFDLADPLRGFSAVWFCAFLIALCFIVDYLHLTLNLDAQNSAKNVSQPITDTLIAILFCGCYFAIARTSASDFPQESVLLYAQICLVLLAIIQFLIFAYDFALQQIRWTWETVPLLIAVGGAAFLLLSGSNINAYHVVMVTTGSVLLVYSARVAFVMANRDVE